MNDIKLLALDMDGTSYHKMQGIVLENIDPIKKAISIGVKVVFVTGRPVLAKYNQLEEHGLVSENSIIIGCNSGCIYDVNTKTVLESNPIKSKTAKQVFEKAIINNAFIWGYTTNLKKVVVSRPFTKDDEGSIECEFFDGEILIYDDVKNNFGFEFFKLLAFDGNEELFTNLSKTLQLNVASNDNVIAEINAQFINKAYGIKWLSKYFDIPIQNIAAIGDGMNDYSMIQLAGVGVAIANSEPAIKEIANVYINKTNTQGAVKTFINEYILKEKNNES